MYVDLLKNTSPKCSPQQLQASRQLCVVRLRCTRTYSKTHPTHAFHSNCKRAPKHKVCKHISQRSRIRRRFVGMLFGSHGRAPSGFAPCSDMLGWATICVCMVVGQAWKRKMSTPGVEPGLSRPQRDVLTTRRCGLGVPRWRVPKSAPYPPRSICSLFFRVSLGASLAGDARNGNASMATFSNSSRNSLQAGEECAQHIAAHGKSK